MEEGSWILGEASTPSLPRNAGRINSRKLELGGRKTAPQEHGHDLRLFSHRLPHRPGPVGPTAPSPGDCASVARVGMPREIDGLLARARMVTVLSCWCRG